MLKLIFINLVVTKNRLAFTCFTINRKNQLLTMAVNLYFFIYKYTDRKNCFTTEESLNQQKVILENFK